jgi:hypothetical protein
MKTPDDDGSEAAPGPGAVTAAPEAAEAVPPEPVPMPASIADGIEHPPSPRHCEWTRAVCWIVTASVSLGLGIGNVITFVAADGLILPSAIALAAWALPTGLLVWWSIRWPALAHQHTSWRLTEEAIEVNHGVWWRVRTTVPRARVQHTDVSQGPIERRLGIASLVIHTAGKEHATVHAHGLEPEIAERIRDHLIASPGGDGI